MARVTRPGADLVYNAAERFRQAALVSGDSMFTPGRPVWASTPLDELHRRFVLQPDLSGDSFEMKLARQLDGADDATIQLMGEMLFFHQLITRKVSGQKKREIASGVLDLMTRPASIPPDLAPALDAGLISPGTLFNTGRDRLIRFLIEWMRSWRELQADQVALLLTDPWAFREQVCSVGNDSVWLQRNAVLHLLFPDTFERMASRSHKAMATAAFADRIGGPEAAAALDQDRSLWQIRTVLTPEFGEGFDFYDTPAVARVWRAPLLLDRVQAVYPGWDGFSFPAYLKSERDYKDKARVLAESLLGRVVFKGLLDQGAHEEVVTRVNKVAQATNLLWLQVPKDGDLAILNHAKFEASAFATAFFDLLHGEGTGPERLERFSAYTTAQGLPTKWAFPTYFLMLLHPETDFFAKPDVTKRFLELVGAGFKLGTKAAGDLYARLLEVVESLKDDLAEFGPRDLIDIQGYVWAAVWEYDKLIKKQPTELDGGHTDGPPTDVAAPDAPPPPPPPDASIYAHLAAAGYHFPDWLITDYLLSLATKPFVILSGISGTGKTKMAQLVAAFVAPDQEVETVAPPVPGDASDGSVPVEVRKSAHAHRRLTIPSQLVQGFAFVPGSAPEDLEVLVTGEAYPARLYVHPSGHNVQIHMKPDLYTWFTANVAVGDYIRMRVVPIDPAPGFQLELETMAVERRTESRPSEQVAFLSVRPDWTDNRALLGYYNPLTETYAATELLRLLLRAHAHPAEPHFVVLDEMNLAKVEYYFSDFLSAMESGTEMVLHDAPEDLYLDVEDASVIVPRRLAVPPNVFFTGTVNVDETTYAFSPKVLDRANTIEFNEVHLANYGVGAPPSDGWFRLPEDTVVAGHLEGSGASPTDWQQLPDEFKERLRALHALLELHHLHFGYRVANEVAKYLGLAARAVGPDALEMAFDLQILQKVLPKLAGNRGKLERPLWDLLQWCVDPSADLQLFTGAALASLEMHSAAYPRSAAKLKRMLTTVQTVGFVSFVE